MRHRFRIGGLAAAVAVGAIAIAAAVVPYDRAALDYGALASVRVVARDGSALRVTRGGAESRAEWMPLDHVSERVIDATLAAEDRRFFRHPGVDSRAIARAAMQNLRAGRVIAGGSTINQQLAGLVWPEPRSAIGKYREAVRALRLEHDLSKREILEQYLNRLPYGNGTQGIEAASRHWFGRSATSLSASQAATLAALPQSPARLARASGRDALRARRDRILGAMARRGDLAGADAESATSRPLEVDAEAAPFSAPHFADWVLHESRATLPRAARLETTLDPALQSDVEGVVQTSLQALRGRGVHEMAIVVESIEGGEILALVGSPDWDASQVNGALALRQPGSALKPFVYAAAFEAGMSAADLLADLPFAALDGAHGEVAPRNYDGRWHGPVRARDALASSFNVPAVRVQNELGTRRVLETLRQAGLETLDGSAETYGLGLTLGVGEVTLLELTTAYAGLARGGLWRPAIAVRAAWDARGRALALPAAAAARWTSPAAAFVVADILADDVARIPGFGSNSILDLPFPVAVKTGTSTDYRNSWCIGFTRDHVVGVWVGNFDGSSLRGLAGASGAGPVFRSVMLRLRERGSRSWTAMPPPGWSRQPVCALSGGRPTGACPAIAAEWFAAGANSQRPACTFHRRENGQAIVEWPPEYRDWARDPTGAIELAHERHDTPRIASPLDGAVYFRDPRLSQQAIRFTAAAPAAGDRWFLDGRGMPSSSPAREVWWEPAPGRHRLELRRGAAIDAIEFSVR